MPRIPHSALGASARRWCALAGLLLTAASGALELRCEGSGKEGKALTRKVCNQVDKTTVHIVADFDSLRGGASIIVIDGVTGLAVDVHPGKNDRFDDGKFDIEFANEADTKDPVHLLWMEKPGVIGRSIMSLPGGTGARHHETAVPQSVFSLTIVSPSNDRWFQRCGQRANLHCQEFGDDIREALKQRKYTDAIGFYELLSKTCIVSTSNAEAGTNAFLPRMHPESDVSAAKLRHEAMQLRYLVEINRTRADPWLKLASHFELMAKKVDFFFGQRERLSLEEMYSHAQLQRDIAFLEPEDSKFCVSCQMNKKTAKGTIQRDWTNRSVLHTSTDFKRVSEDFWTKGVAIIDDVFSPEALEEFHRYLLEEARYTKVRKKYMEATPPTFQPRVLAGLARDLEARLPEIFGHEDVHLMRWWAFQQVDSQEQPTFLDAASRQGVDMHADSAMVSLNLFSTPDWARVSGGGLHIWRVLPSSGTSFSSYNKQQWDAQQTEKITRHPRETVPYKYNRAALFMSDLFHQTEDFEFRPGHDGQRVNVAILWGDKQPSGTLFSRRPHRFKDTASLPHVEL